jgi:hypothetical protein
MNNKWISVEEALPKYNQRVLVVCTNQENFMQEHVSICTFWGDNHLGIPRPYPMWSGKKTVTHWMPLPELPNKEGKDAVQRIQNP